MAVETFQYDLIKRYVILFGNLFNNISINREDANGKNIETIEVPYMYGPRDKMLARVSLDPNVDRKEAINLPVMSFEYKNFRYDPTRKLNTMNQIMSTDGNSSVYSPVPYNIDFNLYVYSKNANDGNRIVEQIFPMFTPDWTAKVNLIPSLNIIRDIPIQLNSVVNEDTYEGDFINRRAIIWTLNFTMKAYFFGAPSKTNLIKLIDNNFYATTNLADPYNTSEKDVTIETFGGQTTDGQASSDPNNANNVPYQDVDITKPYGYIEEWLKG